MKSKLALALLAVILVITTVLASCGGGVEPPYGDSLPKTKTHYAYEYFDTASIFASYLGDSDEAFRQNCSELEAILEKYHKLFDIYYAYSGINNLRTVNSYAGKEPVTVDRELIDFLLYAREMYDLTGGEVNIMMGSVLSIWHRYREDAEGNPNPKIPNEAELAEASLHTSIDALVIDETASTVYISDPKASIDVGALGKGYAAELAAKHLENKGVTSYVLNIGGNICTIGAKTDGTPWTTGITNPDKSSNESFVMRIKLSNTSCVTSGDYERYYVVGDEKYHHIIDKDTLMPAEFFSSITVLTQDSALADALSTALFCMSYEDGLKLVNSLEGVEVLWVDRDYKVYMTDGFADLVINNE